MNSNNDFGVHASHCCLKHGCKYGEYDCPVARSKIKQEYPCESCDDEYDLKPDVSMQDIKSKITTFTSDKLCKMIVTSRYIGFAKDLEKDCMIELAKRRSEGEVFNFEKNIQDTLKTLPDITFGIPDLREVLNKAIGSKLK